MSTRGWYEFYAVENAAKRFSLAMQFYKLGDATPHNAICELRSLASATTALGQRIPVQLVRELLDENLGAAAARLPASFPLGCYYFLLQRAEDEVYDPFADLRYTGMPAEERPDVKLDKALKEAQAKTGWNAPRHGHPVISRAYRSIAVGRLVRPWRECSASMPFLKWLQYITQDSKKTEAGSIAGDYVMRGDARYVYRFFFRVPAIEESDQRVESIDLQVYERWGRALDDAPVDGSGDDADGDDTSGGEMVRSELARLGRQPASLEQLKRTHTFVASPFWEGGLPRDSYLGP